MLNVATMSTNNPVLILGAFALNGLYRVVVSLISLVEWLVPALLAVAFAAATFAAKLLLSGCGLIASHWRVVAMLAGLVAAVVLVALFWQVLLVGAGVLGGMYAGLLAVVRL